MPGYGPIASYAVMAPEDVAVLVVVGVPVLVGVWHVLVTPASKAVHVRVS